MTAARTIDLTLALLLAWWLRRVLWDGLAAFLRLLWWSLRVVGAVTWWWLRTTLRMAGLALAISLEARP
jgi:hypothetical protein